METNTGIGQHGLMQAEVDRIQPALEPLQIVDVLLIKDKRDVKTYHKVFFG